MSPQAKRRSAPQTGPRAAKGASGAPDAELDPMDVSIVVDGTPYKLGDLTLGELEELEDYTGLPMDAIAYGSAKVIAFVVYVVRRRNDPDYTLDDARTIAIRKVRSDTDGVAAAVGKGEGGAAEGGPTPAAGE